MSIRLDERVFSLAFLLSGILFIAMSLQTPLWTGHSPGPGLMPLVYGAAMALVASYSLVATILRGSARSEVVATRTVWIAAAALGGLVLLQLAGYVLAMLVCCTVAHHQLARGPIWRSLLVGLTIAVGFYVLFEPILGIVLPPGMIDLPW